MIRSTRTTTTKAAVIAAFCVIAFSAPARAAAIIDFSSGYALSGGTMTVDAWGNVVGANIGIDLLQVSGTTHDGTYDVSGGPSGNAGILSFDTAKQTINIVGGVSALGISDGTVLLSGSISHFDFNTGLVGVLGMFSATGPDSKNPELLKALGVPTDASFQYFGFSIGFDKLPLDRNSTYNVVNAEIINTQVPEPSTLALLGTGIVGFAARRRWRAS